MAFTGPPILNVDQSTKCKDQKTLRFVIELNDEEDYEMSYLDLIERHLGKHGSVNGTSNGEALPVKAPDGGQNKVIGGVVDDYVKQLDNYGPSVIMKKGSKKRRLQVKDFCDMGYGYDLNDPFIDDTESYDAVVPPDVHAQEGGFYVNSGDIKTIVDNSSDIETWIVGGNPVPSSSDDTPESPKVQKPHFTTPGKPKKRSKQLVSKAVRQLSKPKTGPPQAQPAPGAEEAPKTVPENGPKVPKKRGPYKTKKRPAEESPGVPKATSPKKRALVVNFQSPNTHATVAAPNNGVKEAPEPQEVGETVQTEQDAEAVANVPGGSPVKMTPAQLQSIESTIDAVIRPVAPELLPSVPEAVRATVKRLKEEAKNVNYDAKRFNASTSDELLIRLDGQLRACPSSVRTNVYNHIAGSIPGTKKSFVRRIRKVKEEYEDRKVFAVLEQLKQVVTNLTPDAMKRYETELKVYQEKLAVWKVAYDEYERLKNANLQSSNPVIDLTEVTGESGEKAAATAANGEPAATPSTAPADLGPAPRRPNQPRRVLPITDQMRTLVTRAVLLRLQSFDNLGVKGSSEEQYLKKFLEEQVTPLWPKNWVTMAFLLKLSRTGVEKFRQWRAAVKQQTASERLAQKTGAKVGGNENGLTSTEQPVPASECGASTDSVAAKKSSSSILGTAQVVPNEPGKASEVPGSGCLLTVGLKSGTGQGPVAKPVPAGRGGKVSAMLASGSKALPASKRKISSLLKATLLQQQPKPEAGLPTHLRQDKVKPEKLTPQELQQIQQKLLGRSSLFEAMSGIRDKNTEAKEAFKQPAGKQGLQPATKKSPSAREVPSAKIEAGSSKKSESELHVQLQSHQQWQQQQMRLQQQQQQQQLHQHQQQQKQQTTSTLQQLFGDVVTNRQGPAEQSATKKASPPKPGVSAVPTTKPHRPQVSPDEQLHQIIAEELRTQRMQQPQPSNQQKQQQQQQQAQKQQIQMQQQQNQHQQHQQQSQQHQPANQQQLLLVQQQMRQHQEQLKKQQEAAKRSQQEQVYRQKQEQLRRLQEEQIKKQQEEQLRQQNEQILQQQMQHQEQLRKQQQQEEQMRQQQQQQEQLRIQQLEQLRQQREEQIRQQQQQEQLRRKQQQQQQEEQLRQQQQQEQLRLQQQEQKRKQQQEQIRKQQQLQELLRTQQQQQQQQQEEQLRKQQLEQQYQQQLQQQVEERNRQQVLQQQQQQQQQHQQKLQQQLHQQQLRQQGLKQLQGLKQRTHMQPPPQPRHPHLPGPMTSERPIGHVRGKPQTSPNALVTDHLHQEGLMAASAVSNPELTFGQLSETDAESYLQMKSLHSKPTAPPPPQASMAARSSGVTSPIVSVHQVTSPLRSPTLPPFASVAHHLSPTQRPQAAFSEAPMPSWSGYPVLHSSAAANEVNSFANHPHSLPQSAVSAAASAAYPLFHASSPTNTLPPSSHFPPSHHPPP